MGSNCCKGDAAGRPIKSSSSIYSRSRAGASLDDRFRASEDAGGVRLTVSAARTGDSGIYTLQASNAAGKDTRRLRLEVSAEETPIGDDPPTFLRRLQDLTVKVGTRTRFLVEIVSSTECKVTWYRNERRLMEAERVALVRDGNFWCADVAAVSVDDAGRWTCTAENIGGRASCSAHLNVLVPKAYKRPEFVEELRAVLTEQGTVSLECKVVGVPTPVLRWFKDSREIKAGDVFALTANAEDPTSLGTYTCEAVNCMGRAYSSSKVHVIGRGSRDGSLRPTTGGVSPEPPLIFTKELEAQSVKICDPLTLSCHIVVPPWPRSVVWYNKEGKIEPNERYHVIEDGVGGYLVEVTSAEWRDEGEWKCVATSAGGRLGITTCNVTMDVPKNFRKPRFMENLQAVLTEEGLVSFECKVVGFPTPVLSWFKDGQELKPGDVYQLTGTNSLGSYCCIARNCMGQASSSAELTVEDIQNQLNEEEKLQLFSKNQAPKFIQGLKSVEAKIDEPFRFTVKVAIPPEPSVLWYRDDQPVDDSPRCHLDKEERGGFFLDIRNLEFLDQAEWKCVAINDFGHSITSCFLKLIIPRHYKKPRFLENLQAILSDEGAVNLECKVIGVPQPVLKWYKDGEELKPGDIHRIISGQDGTCCLGTYTCEAQNCMGIAASSASLLGFDDSTKMKNKKKIDEQTLQRNLSLSTIHEERTSQMYDTPVGDITLDDKGEISFSFDGKEVSVSLYETPDLTEEEALQIVEMYADQLSENITEHNVVELPPLRFVKETSNSGNLLMEAIIIDVSPDYFASPEEDLRTEADIEDISIADENVPSQLSLDQDLFVEEKNIPALSHDKSELSQNLKRKKSDSQKSADEYFSLSREHSLSEEKIDDDTEVMTESDLLSYASAHSSGKPRSKIAKVSDKFDIKAKEEDTLRTERRNSRSSRRSSTDSEKSLTKRREELAEKQINLMEQTISLNKLKEDIESISTPLNILINAIQKLENDVILKSELMSSVVTASKSIEIINSVLLPLSEMRKIINDSKVDTNEADSTFFDNISQPLKSLQQALTVIEKCIDVESENRTLVKKTCVLLIEKCSNQFQELMIQIKLIKTHDCGKVENKKTSEIESIANEIITIVNFTAGTIKTRNLLIEADEFQAIELSIEDKHLIDTQKGIHNLKRPLISLLNIVKNAEVGTMPAVANMNNSLVILTDMSASIQDLQSALEQIELLSVKENSQPLNKYNTEIISSVMDSVLELRNSFEHLSAESKNMEDNTILNEKLNCVKNNINNIFIHLNEMEKNVGVFNILQSDYKLETLQRMAHILIFLENNLTNLDFIPAVKESMTLLHKNLTKVLENVIESNEAKKYNDLIEVCDAVKRINNCIQNIDSHTNLSLISINNTLNIIKDCLSRNIFEPNLNNSIIINISEIQICIQEILNKEENVTFNYDYEYPQSTSEHVCEAHKARIVTEHIDRTLAAITMVTTFQLPEEQKLIVLPKLENMVPILEELKCTIASLDLSGIEREEHVSEITDSSSQSIEILAKSLFEINRHVSVLNETLLEDPESIKEKCQPFPIFAEALSELCGTLEIVQHDIISQIGEFSYSSLSYDFANTVQNLHSAILIINDNYELEVPGELSTLEDITGLKTTADTVFTDHLAIPGIEQKEIQECLEPITESKGTSSLVQILKVLNKHITTLQNPEIMDIIQKLSENDAPTSLSLPTKLTDLHSGIQEILHPMMLQRSEMLTNVVNITEVGALLEPMLALQQSLPVITTENIPILESILDISSDSIHSVYQSISLLKDHVEKCIYVLLPALEVTNNTVKVSNVIGTIKEACQVLRDLIADASVSSTTSTEKLQPLNILVKKILDNLDVSKGIHVEQIKLFIEELYKESSNIEEEILSLIPRTTNQKQEEAHMLEVLHEIKSSICVLEQCEYIDISDAFDLYYCKEQQATEIQTELLCQLEDVLITTTNVMQDFRNNSEVRDDIVHFISTCQNEFVILRSLVNKKLTYKSVIRLYQEFIILNNCINLFKANMLKLNVSNDIEQTLLTFFENTTNFLDKVRFCIINILENKMTLIFNMPMRALTKNCEILAVEEIPVELADFTNLTQNFLKAKDIILPSFYNLDDVIINDLKLNASNYDVSIIEEDIINTIEKLETIFEEYVLLNNPDIEQQQKMEELRQKHCDFINSVGRAKQLILLKYMEECSEMLKDITLKNNNVQSIKLQKTKLLQILLSQMSVEISIFREKLREDYSKFSYDKNITSVHSYIYNLNGIMQKIIENFEQSKDVNITIEDKSLIMKVSREIINVKIILKSLHDKIMPSTIPTDLFLNDLYKIEDLVLTLLPLQEAKSVQHLQMGELKQHIQNFISTDCVKIVKDVGLLTDSDNADEILRLATELDENINMTLLENALSEVSLLKDAKVCTGNLALRLQKAVSEMQLNIKEKIKEISMKIDDANLQHVSSVLTNLCIEINELNLSGKLMTTGSTDETINDFLKDVDTSGKIGECIKQAVQNLDICERDKYDKVSLAECEKSRKSKELLREKQEFDIGKVMEHIDEFVSQDSVQIIQKVALTSTAVDAEKAITLATQLKEHISAISVSPENEASETLAIENLNESNISLASELQQALSVVITEIYEKAEELSLQFDENSIQNLKGNLTTLCSDLNAIISSAQVVEKVDDVKQAVVVSEHAINLEMISEDKTQILHKEEVDIGKVMEHIDEFVSQDSVQIIQKVALTSTAVDAEKAINLATQLKGHISAISVSPENEASGTLAIENLNESNLSLASELQQALSVVITEIYEKAEELSLQFDEYNIQNLKGNLTSLCSDLNAIISSVQVLEKVDDVKQAVKNDVMEIDGYDTKNTVHNLKSLLKEVCDSISVLSTTRTADDVETLQNNLDEIQAVIIELKRDYSDSLNDTLNETLQDLECSVRSVQLQINEESPPELVKEACETLQLLVTNMCEMHEFQAVQTISHKDKLGSIIYSCCNDTEETIHLLESALSIKSDDEEFNKLYTYVNNLQLVIKSLKLSFADNSDNIIEKGIEIMQTLDQVEDQVFALEKEVDVYINLTAIQRDSVVTAVHSVYGSISNIRSAMSSIQKHYMYENYGKSSELVLTALKRINFIANKGDKKWKILSKSLRKVLNHFEDVKFYINFDKTARIPSDASFTKIILLDLKAAIDVLLYDDNRNFGHDVMFNAKCIVECLEKNLLNIESKSNLQVKEKIPIFKEIATKIYVLTNSVNEYLELCENNERENNMETLQSQDSMTVEMSKLTKQNMLDEMSIDESVKKEQLGDTVSDILRGTIEEGFINEIDSNISAGNSNIEKQLFKNNADPTDDVDIKDENKNITYTLKAHEFNFDLEVFPVTIMTENILETSTLNIEECKLFEEPLLQTIDTDIFHTAQISESVIGFIVDKHFEEGPTINKDLKGVLKIDNETLDTNKIEFEPMSEENNDHTLSGHKNHTNEDLKNDVKKKEAEFISKESIDNISKVSDPETRQQKEISPHKNEISIKENVDLIPEKVENIAVGENVNESKLEASTKSDTLFKSEFAIVDDRDLSMQKDPEKDKRLVISNKEDFTDNEYLDKTKFNLVKKSEIIDNNNEINNKNEDKDTCNDKTESNGISTDNTNFETDILPSSEQRSIIKNSEEHELDFINENMGTPENSNVKTLQTAAESERLLVDILQPSTELKTESDTPKISHISTETSDEIQLHEVPKTNAGMISEAENIDRKADVKEKSYTTTEEKDGMDGEMMRYKIIDEIENIREIKQEITEEELNIHSVPSECKEDTNDIKKDLVSSSLLSEIKDSPALVEDNFISQNDPVKQTITDNEVFNDNNNQYKDFVTEDGAESMKLSKPDVETETEKKEQLNPMPTTIENTTNIETKNNVTGTEEEATGGEIKENKHQVDKEKIKRKKKGVKSKNQTLIKMKSEENEQHKSRNDHNEEEKIIKDLPGDEVLNIEEELLDTPADIKVKSSEEDSSKASKTKYDITLDQDSDQESKSKEILSVEKTVQKQELQLREDIQEPETLERITQNSEFETNFEQVQKHDVRVISKSLISDSELNDISKDTSTSVEDSYDHHEKEKLTDVQKHFKSDLICEKTHKRTETERDGVKIDSIKCSQSDEENYFIDKSNEQRSSEEPKVPMLERSGNGQLNDRNEMFSKELERPSQDNLNMSQIRQIDLKNYDQKYDESATAEYSDTSPDTRTKSNSLFVDRTKNYYDSEFLRPPGYIEKTFNNEYPLTELNTAQNCTFYKAQTLVRNTQYTSPTHTDKIQNEEIIDKKDVSHKLRALNETRNILREKRSKLLRDVKRKPVFSTYLTDRTAVEGSRVKLTCSVLTTTEPKVVWFKNGVPLDNSKLKYKIKSIDGLLTLEVLNAEPSDSAEYVCTVETENGTVTTSANLKVYPSFEVSPIPPTFTRSIRDTYHLAENELVLECRIRGQPLPIITWIKDDKCINITDRYQAYYLADGVCRLVISNPTSEDSGKYTCKAENSMWSDQISHIVTFTGKDAHFGHHSNTVESCRLNRKISESCRPHFTNVLTDYKVTSGGTIGLQVEIKGSPTRVEWLREGHAVTDIYRNAQTFVDHGLYTLALSDVTEKESGLYTCRAWSNYGNVDMTAAITVVKPNEIDGKPAVIIGRPQKDVLISVGEDLNISFRVQGEPKPKVFFMKGIRDITNSPRACKMKSDDYVKFTLKRSVVSDAGTYCILARNAYGCDRAFVTVVVRQRASSDHLISDWTYPTDMATTIGERRFKSVPNRIPGEPSVVDGGNNWISLAWPKVDPEGGAPVLAYKIESWLLGKEGGARWVELGITPLNTFEAYNLKQGEEYHFRVTPRNRYGWGESVQTSIPVGVGLGGDRPEFIEVLPGQLKVLVGETATLKCSFKGKPIPEIIWMKNGHEVDEENQRLKTCLSNYNCSLTINDVQINDEARYSCEATNVHGRASTYARIAVVTDKSIWEADTKLKRERSSDGGECPPQFTMRLRDRRVQATYPVRLTCQVIGRPPPVVTWYKNGEEVIDDNRHTKSQDEHFHTLEIAPTRLEDGGLYEATARNGSGAISCRCNLVVDKGIRAYIAPEFCCGLDPLYQLSIGQELRISAVVEAYPSVGVTWYRDGVRLRPSRRAVMTLDRDGQIELAVASVTQRDAGVYTCTASNEVGKASTSGKVEVFGESDGDRKQMIPIVVCPDVPYSREPTFIRKPRSSEAYEGDTIIIECEVTGDPKPDVYWLRDFLKPDYYRDGSHFKRVGDGPEYRFEIPHAKLDYTGAYSVVARNIYGEAKAVISLQILAKDPRSTEEAHNVRYGRVEVIPRFEKELTDLLSHDGDAVEFECRVTGEPEPDVKWYHYTKIIRESSDFEMRYELGTARLKIKQVTADDEGTYTCEAYNYLGKATSSACLVVYPAGEPNTLSQRLRRPPMLLSGASTPRSTPARSISRTRTPGPEIRNLCSPAREIAPKFYTYPYNKVVEEGDSVVFQCAAKGLPAPWATWDKDGVIITPSSRITIKEKDEIFRILEIDEVNSEDVGLYRVTLENDYGRAEASARLEVISQKGKFYTRSGRSYSASPRKSLPYKRSMYSVPRQD